MLILKNLLIIIKGVLYNENYVRNGVCWFLKVDCFSFSWFNYLVDFVRKLGIRSELGNVVFRKGCWIRGFG